MGRKRSRASQGVVKRKKSRLSSSNVKKETDLDFISKEDYVVVGSLMYVRPYAFEFKTNFKPRWRNKTVHEVFCQEFRHAEPGYWLKEFREGRVVSDGRPVEEDVVWHDGLQVVHIVHRHESAVLAGKIHVAHDGDGFVVVSKPPSVPIHPCGTYRRNCLQFILKAFNGFETLHAVHRLDKETSGLVIFAKNPESASRFSEAIKEHRVQKTYIAEVHGSFPANIRECAEPIYWDKREMRASIRPDGAEAKTCFRMLGENLERKTSIVECKPFTGRTHQIRVHLSHLGHGIVNDPLYGKGELSDQTSPLWARSKPDSALVSDVAFNEDDDTTHRRRTYLACEWSKSAFQTQGRHLSCAEEGKALSCTNCPQVSNLKNVEIKAMYIHLHALKYESEEWCFEVPPPPWIGGNDTGRTETWHGKTDRMSCAIS